MRSTTWQPVRHPDEYSELGDTVYLDTVNYAYYYNPRRRVLRRYGLDGSYAEIFARTQARAFPSTSLAGVLATRFASARRHNSLLVYEPGQPEPLAA